MPLSYPEKPHRLTDARLAGLFSDLGPANLVEPVEGEAAKDFNDLDTFAASVVTQFNALEARVAGMGSGANPSALTAASLPLDLAAVFIAVEQGGQLRKLSLADLFAAIPDATFILRG